MAEVKFCENNFQYGTDETVNKLEDELSEVEVEVAPCLGFCGDCAEGPYALVNGEMVQADNAGELFDLIKDAL